MSLDSEMHVLQPDAAAVLRSAVASAYPPDHFAGEGGDESMDAEVHARLYWFRNRYLPWLQSHVPISGASVLEFGAGTGAASVCLAEAGARVTGFDVEERYLEVGRLRASLHDVAERVTLTPLNGKDVDHVFPDDEQFDVVVLFAALEHMTHPERVASLRSAWRLLKRGGHLVAVDTPNRLWYFDNHTAFEMFYHWLPDDVAIDYAQRTSRPGFNTEFVSPPPDAVVKLARWGRGVSYHDFEIALGDLDGMEINGEWEFRRHSDPAWSQWWASQPDGRYHDFLREVVPDRHPAFLEPELAFSIRKQP